MKVHFNEGTLRVGLIVSSLIYGILSVSLIALGIAYADELKWPRSYADWRLLDMPSFVITMGAMSLVISIVGCYCAKTYRRKIFLLFVVGLCALLVLQLFVAIVALTYDPVERKHRTLMLMQESVELKGTDIYFKQLEDHFRCCGLYGNETRCNALSKMYTIPGCAEKISSTLDSASLTIGYSAVIFMLFASLEAICAYLICTFI